MYRNVQSSNGSISRGSTLERPVGRTVIAYPSTAAVAAPVPVPAGHLVTTTADVEHHHHPQHHQSRAQDMRSPLPVDSSPYAVFDTNQVGLVN